jgi:hypothetical protein
MTPNQWIYTAALLLLLLNGIDIVQTGLLLRYAGKYHESGPIMASLIDQLGLDQALWVKLWSYGLIVMLFPFIYKLPLFNQNPECLLFAPILLLPTIINNGMWMIWILLGFPI